MTTTFMIAAHSDPKMLHRLVSRLRSPASRFLIHIDAKADIQPFVDVFEPGQVEFTSWRMPVWWVDYGLCQVALRMLRDSLKDGASKRFFFMSGADYPACPISSILDISDDIDIIRIDRRLDAISTDWFSRTAFRYHFMSGRHLNPRTANPTVRKIIDALSRRLRRNPPPFPIYQGPSWWSLSRSTAEAVVSLSLQRPEILAWFRWSFCPEELLFQTLVKQIPSANITQDGTLSSEPLKDDVHATHYVKFQGPSPKTLTISDAEEILNSGAIFARKFDRVISLELMETIDRAIDAVAAD